MPQPCSVNVVVFGSDPVRAYLYRGGSLLVGRTKVPCRAACSPALLRAASPALLPRFPFPDLLPHPSFLFYPQVDRPDTIPSDFINSLTLHITEITRDPLAWMHEMNATLSEAQMDAVWQQIEVGGRSCVRLCLLLRARLVCGWRAQRSASPLQRCKVTVRSPFGTKHPINTTARRRRPRQPLWRPPCPRCGGTGRAAARTDQRQHRSHTLASTMWLTQT